MTRDVICALKKRMNKRAALRLYADDEKQCRVMSRLFVEHVDDWIKFAESVKREARAEFVRRHGRAYGLRFGELRLRDDGPFFRLYQWDELSVIAPCCRYALSDWDQSLYRDVRAMSADIGCELMRDVQVGDAMVSVYRIALSYRNYSRRLTKTVSRRMAWTITKDGVDL